MSNMSDEKLRKIEQIKKEWAAEVEKIDSDEEFIGFNQQKCNEQYKVLEKKYLPQIMELMD